MKALRAWEKIKSQISVEDRAKVIRDTPDYLRKFYDKLPKQIRVHLMALYLFVKNEPFSKSAPAVAALFYFIMPTDILPDVLPMLGFADDIAVLHFVIHYMREGLKPYLAEAQEAVDSLKKSESGQAGGDNLH